MLGDQGAEGRDVLLRLHLAQMVRVVHWREENLQNLGDWQGGFGGHLELVVQGAEQRAQHRDRRCWRARIG